MSTQGATRRVEPRKLPSRRSALARVEKILATTRELVMQQGLETLSTNQIAEHAGIPVGSVYQYFPNKQAIVYALIQDWLSVLEDKLDAFPIDACLEMSRDEALKAMSQTVTAPSSFAYERKLGRMLLGAIDLYPELRELNDAHIAFCVESSVKFMKALGSRWSTARLRKLGRYLLEIRRTLYYTPDDLVADAIKWQEAATIAVISQCLDPPKA